jgi:hypothetical protein
MAASSAEAIPRSTKWWPSSRAAPISCIDVLTSGSGVTNPNHQVDARAGSIFSSSASIWLISMLPTSRCQRRKLSPRSEPPGRLDDAVQLLELGPGPIGPAEEARPVVLVGVEADAQDGHRLGWVLGVGSPIGAGISDSA